jgi:hypothetical protein
VSQASTEEIAGYTVSKADASVKMLHTCVKARASKADKEAKLQKLVDRINLDRPILQKEKIKLILFEAQAGSHDKKNNKELTVREIK